ncbi:MAG: hypothetical protein R3A10_12750 [Caldilineaceae bacterium]
MAAVLSNDLAWRWGYVFIAGAQTLVAVLIIATLDNWRNDDAGDGTSAADVTASARDCAHAGDAAHGVWANILLFLLYAGTRPRASGQYSLFTESRGIDIAVAGFWVSVYRGTFTVGRLFYGFIADRVDSVKAVRFSMVIAVLAALLLWWNMTDLIRILGLAVMGFAAAPIFPLLTSTTPGASVRVHTPTSSAESAANLGIAILPGPLAGVRNRPPEPEIIGPFLFIASLAMLILYELILHSERRET